MESRSKETPGFQYFFGPAQLGRGMIENYFNYIKKRMEEDDGLYLKTFWSELRHMGYPGGYSTLSEALAYYGIRIGKKTSNPKSPQQSGSFFKPSNAAMLFLTPENKLNTTQKELINNLCNHHLA